MDEVKRYTFKGAAGEYVYAGDFEKAVRCFLDSAERCIAAERREKSLQQRLTTADERNDAAVDLLRRCRAVVDGTGWVDLERDIVAFLKPADADRDQGIPGTSFQRLNALANQGE